MDKPRGQSENPRAGRLAAGGWGDGGRETFPARIRGLGRPRLPMGEGYACPRWVWYPQATRKAGPHPSCPFSVLSSQERAGDQEVFEAPSSSVQFCGLVHERMSPNLKNADVKMGSFRVLVGYGLITESYPTLFATLWTVARPAPLSMGLPSQEYWSGLPFPPPGDLPTQGSYPCLLHWQEDSLLLSHLGRLKPFQRHRITLLAEPSVCSIQSTFWKDRHIRSPCLRHKSSQVAGKTQYQAATFSLPQVPSLHLPQPEP